MDIDLLPDEIQQQMEDEDMSRLEDYDRLCNTLVEKRSEAIQGRMASGIEATWMASEEAYIGIDDYNRHEFAGAKWAKPTSIDGPLSTVRRDSQADRSTVYIPLTSRYVDAGYAKLCEIVLPLDDKAFSFDATPIPDLVVREKDEAPVVDPTTGQPLAKAAIGEKGEQAQQQLQVKDLIAKEIEAARDAAGKAERRIYDWMVEAGHHAEMRKVVHDMARIGVGVLKGPFPDYRMSKAVVKDEQGGGIALKLVQQMKPAEKWVDPWNAFPDAACGEDIQLGDYFFERDFISPRTLKKLAKQDGYLKDQIKKVLKEGPGKCNTEGRNPNEKDKKRSYEIWYFYGALSRKDLEIVNAQAAADMPDDIEDMYAIVTMVNDSIIKAVINPLESGDYPYHAVPWRRRSGHWAGVGVSEQITVPQRICNGATRAMMNNAGKSAGSQIVMDQGAIVPADGVWAITPDKLWYKSPDAIQDDVRKAFAMFQTPNMTPQLLTIIEYAFRLAEESTSIPLVTQGQTGPTTPETYGAAQLQNNNAMSLLRSIAYMVDDHLTEPLVDQYYEWLLLDPSVPDDEKGDFQVNAHGSIALVERAIADQTLVQMVGMAVNPAFGVDPKKVMQEFMKSKRIDPRSVEYTEQEMQAMAQQQQPPMPQVQAAQIRAEADMQKAKMQAEIGLQKIKVDQDRDQVYVAAETERTRVEHEVKMAELGQRLQLAQLEYANRNNLQLADLKAQLSIEAAKLNTQKELASLGAKSSLMAKPPTEPPGRAQDGMSYQQ